MSYEEKLNSSRKREYNGPLMYQTKEERDLKKKKQKQKELVIYSIIGIVATIGIIIFISF